MTEGFEVVERLGGCFRLNGTRYWKAGFGGVRVVVLVVEGLGLGWLGCGRTQRPGVSMRSLYYVHKPQKT